MGDAIRIVVLGGAGVGKSGMSLMHCTSWEQEVVVVFACLIFFFVCSQLSAFNMSMACSLRNTTQPLKRVIEKQ